MNGVATSLPSSPDTLGASTRESLLPTLKAWEDIAIVNTNYFKRHVKRRKKLPIFPKLLQIGTQFSLELRGLFPCKSLIKISLTVREM
jgi:hypothetical protein